MNRFTTLFANNQPVFIPFFMLGQPTLEASFELIKTAIDSGVKALELGIPFSDPLADGPVIQHAAETALKNGATFEKCIQLIEKIRQYDANVAIGLLLYYNLLFRQNEMVYARLKQAGVDALLVADLPVEEAAKHAALMQQNHLGLVNLVSPNTPLERAKKLIETSDAFTYVTSMMGVTGMRDKVSDETIERLKILKDLHPNDNKKPLVVGFGISTPEQVKQLFAAGADGAIIGSRICAEVENNPDYLQAVKQLFLACLT